MVNLVFMLVDALIISQGFSLTYKSKGRLLNIVAGLLLIISGFSLLTLDTLALFNVSDVTIDVFVNN